jgi:hypothetical protein
LKASVPVTCTDWLAGSQPAADAPMFALPKLTPVTVGWVLGEVWPGAIETVVGETVTFVGSLLDNTTWTPAAGAGFDKVTGNEALWLAPTTTPDVRPSDPKITVTLAVALPPGVVAVIVAGPAETPVTGTLTVVAPCVKLTLAGTVAAPVLLEERLTVSPPDGAGAVKFNARFIVVPAVIVKLFCGKLSGVKTCTV